jgi:hypothetical protein
MEFLDITYTDVKGTVISRPYSQLPWSIRLRGVKPGAPLSVSAFNGSAPGCLTIELLIRGDVAKDYESCGAGAIVSAKATYTEQ